MGRPQKVNVTPAPPNPYNPAAGAPPGYIEDKTPQVWDGDRAGFHATTFFRLLSIRTQTAVVLAVAMFSVAWIWSSLCGMISAYFSH